MKNRLKYCAGISFFILLLSCASTPLKDSIQEINKIHILKVMVSRSTLVDNHIAKYDLKEQQVKGFILNKNSEVVDTIFGTYKPRLRYEYNLSDTINAMTDLENVMGHQDGSIFASHEETRTLPGYTEIMQYLSGTMPHQQRIKIFDAEEKDYYSTTNKIFKSAEMKKFLLLNPHDAFIIAYINYKIGYTGDIEFQVPAGEMTLKTKVSPTSFMMFMYTWFDMRYAGNTAQNLLRPEGLLPDMPVIQSTQKYITFQKTDDAVCMHIPPVPPEETSVREALREAGMLPEELDNDLIDSIMYSLQALSMAEEKEDKENRNYGTFVVVGAEYTVPSLSKIQSVFKDQILDQTKKAGKGIGEFIQKYSMGN